MPLPLIPLAVAGVVALAAGGVAVVQTQKAKKKLEGKKVAVIGGEQTGKTALLHYLEQGTWLDSSTPSPNVDKSGRTFELDIDGATVAFSVTRDVSGTQGPSYLEWRKAVEDAHYIWYLFRADRVDIPDSEDAQLVAKHLRRLTHWLKESGSKATVILVGTHADLHPRFPGDFSQIFKEMNEIEAIKVASLKIGARVVVGSLHTPEDAKKLRDQIRGKL
ncbi:GTPase domain-containing protein [Microbacterium sp.]|uniref:GTPase domain-containing protein n=1 Tax=Microbacterium sp. TaxID=51671 RepID=UPI00261CA4E3|nr:GTPase domain-containing protein [Microbacterium sp.]